MWHAGDGTGWWMVWGALMMVLFWGAIIALVVWAVQSLARRDSGGSQPGATTPAVRTPLDIARERYARGEIGRDEFEQMRRDLEDT